MPEASADLSLLSAMITPAVLISACGTLIFSTSTRLARIVDRVRQLSQSFEHLYTESVVDFPEERRIEVERQLVLAGAILGLFNLIVRPLAMLISLPLLIVTLGLFYFILNGILLWLAQFILPGYSVRDLVAGILGALVMTIVNWVLQALLGR